MLDTNRRHSIRRTRLVSNVDHNQKVCCFTDLLVCSCKSVTSTDRNSNGRWIWMTKRGLPPSVRSSCLLYLICKFRRSSVLERVECVCCRVVRACVRAVRFFFLNFTLLLAWSPSRLAACWIFCFFRNKKNNTDPLIILLLNLKRRRVLC